MVKAYALLTTAVLALSSATLRAKAACECGYLDPSTNHLWTDASFSYFNETGLEDIVMNPAKSPKTDGMATAGDTGDGQQTWSAVGDHINPYEESFGATYLSAVSYNNTYIDNRTEGLAMEVSKANQKTHVVNGSSLVTRRRDILYGSFRASIKPPFINPVPGSDKGYGSGFEFSVSYNDSERMHVQIYTHDYMPNSTLGWSYAAARRDDAPVNNNLTYFHNFTQTNSTIFLEHRMEWLNKSVIQYKNNAENRSVGFYEYIKGKNATNLPTTPAPVSLQAWANGEPSGSQGPPAYEPNVVRIMYTRFFFNSSRLDRHDQFNAQCAAAMSSANAVCSTEDYTLRESTPFDMAATLQIKLQKPKYHVPIWAAIIELFFLFVLIITVAHGLYIRKIKDQEKKRKAAALALAEEEEKQAALLEYDDIDDQTNSPRSKSGADFEKPYKQIWAVPELMDDWASDGESDIDEDDARFWESVDVLRSTDYKEDREANQPGLPHYKDATAMKPSASTDSLDSFQFPRAGSSSPPRDEDNKDGWGSHARATSAPQNNSAPQYGGHVRANSSNRIPAANQFNLVNRPNFPRENSNMRQQLARGISSRNNPYGAGNVGGVGSSPRFDHYGEEEETETLAGDRSSTNSSTYPPARPNLNRFDSYESDIQVPTHSHDAARTQRYLQDSSSNVSLPYIAPKYAASGGLHSAHNSTASLLNYSGSGGGNTTGVGASHGYSSSVNINWEQEPKIIQWNKRKSMGVDMVIGQLAQPAMGDKNAARRLSTVVHPAPNSHSFFTVIYRRVYNFFFISGDGMKTASGDARIDYLDGMRGFACLFVSLGHFILMFWNAIANFYGPHHYYGFEYWTRVIFGPIIINAGLVLGIFFLLPSRTMGSRYLVKGGVQSLADNSVRRMPRLIIPAAGACLANYLMIDVGAYKWVPRMNSLTWSTWAYYQNYTNAIEFVDSFIALWWASPPDNPALVTHYATGVLWTIPVIVQGAWTCMLCAVFAHEIKTAWKRFFFYFCCILLSWYAQTWDLFFMAGLVIADLDINLKYRKWGEMGIPLLPKGYAKLLRIPERIRQKFAIKGKIFAWAFFFACCVQEWLAYIPDAPGANFDTWDIGVHPNFYNSKPNKWNDDVGYMYQRPRTSAWFFVMSIFILADHSAAFRQIFRLRIWSFLGKHSMSYFLLHGIIFWTWGSWLSVTMLTHGVDYFATIMVVFITSYILLTIFCICFTYTFEYWGIIASKAFWRATSGNLGRRAGA